MMKRREFLTISAAAATILVVGCGSNSGGGSNTQSSSDISEVDDKNFDNVLQIPPLLEPRIVDGIKNYDLSIQEGTHSFFEGKITNTYGINGNYLGPTLRFQNADMVSINYTNNLNETTTMHGHGMHLPASMDGGPHQQIKPTETWSAQFTVNQKACTNWYHSHLMGKTAEHVYKGLAGLIMIDDEESQSLDLPKNYGVDDIPLVLQDRFFDANYQLDYSPSMMEVMMGYKGDIFITNGVINPFVEVEAKEIRFRILNGSNSTVYTLGFDDNRFFKQIATDNSFLNAPVSLNRVRLSPGERAEIVVDLSGEIDNSLHLKDFTQNKDFLKIDVTKSASIQTSTPSILTTLDIYNPDDVVNRRNFTLSGRRDDLFINDKSMDINRIDEVVPLGQVEIWEVYNSMRMEHNFHIHATHFMILERNGNSADVLENEKGYKDTIYLAPGDRVKLIIKMVDYADEVNPYMYHCHFLEHEDAGMMGQFTVV